MSVVPRPPCIEAHAAFVRRLRRWAEARDDVRALVVVGSVARGEARPDSDLDVVLLTIDPARYVDRTGWMAELGSVRTVEREEYGRVTSLRARYDDGVEVELGVAPADWASGPVDPRTEDVACGGIVVLMDRDGHATALARAVGRASPADPSRDVVLAGDGVMTLGLFRPSDAPVLRDGDGDPEHRRRFDFPADFVPSLEHAEDVVARWACERVAGERFALAVRAADTGALLGGCELRPLGHGVASLSYWTYPAHRGRGVASRAVALACRVAFELFAIGRLEVAIDPDNAASLRAARRSGFAEAGVRDGRVLYVKRSP